MVSAERWIGSRQRWSGMRAPASHVAPEARRRGQPRRGLVDVGRRREPLGPRQRAVEPLARVQRRAGRGPGCPRCRAPGRSAAGSSGRRRVASAVCRSSLDERPLGGDAPVVEHRLADQLDLDVPVDAHDGAHQQVVGVVVGRRPRVRGDRVLAAARPHRQRVADHRPSRSASARSSPACWCPGSYDARRRVVDAERRRAGTCRPRGRAGCRRRSASRSAARTASRSSRPARPARRCGSWTGTRSRRSAGTATAPPRSAAARAGMACAPSLRAGVAEALMTPPTGRASRRAGDERVGRRRAPRSPARTAAPAGGESSSGCMTRHVSSTPSWRVKRVLSPIIAACSSTSYGVGPSPPSLGELHVEVIGSASREPRALAPRPAAGRRWTGRA